MSSVTDHYNNFDDHCLASCRQQVKRRPDTRKWILATALALGVIAESFLQFDALNVYASEQKIYEATYAVEFNGLRLGTSTRTVSVSSESTVISQHLLVPQGLAKLMGESEYEDTVTIDMTDFQIQPIEVQRKSDDVRDSFIAKFNWNDRKIEFVSGSQLEMPADHPVHVLESLILLLMADPERQNVGDLNSVLEKENRLRTYFINSVKKDLLLLDGHNVNTLRYELQDVDDGSRSYFFWIMPEFHNLLAKLVRQKKSDDLTISLTGFRNLVDPDSQSN